MLRLLFAIHYLELGGAERSLIGLLRALDYSKVKVDLFVYSHRGELMKEILYFNASSIMSFGGYMENCIENSFW